MRKNIIPILFFLTLTLISGQTNSNACAIIVEEAVEVDSYMNDSASIIPLGLEIEFIGQLPDATAWIVGYNDEYYTYPATSSDIRPEGCEPPMWGPPSPRYRSLESVMDEVGITAWHEQGFFGRGVRVGILDTRYDDLSATLTGLPISESQVTFIPSLTDLETLLSQAEGTEPFHGTNVLEVMVYIAPEADYVIARSVDAESFQQAVDSLIAADVDIIVHAGNVITADPRPYHTAVRRAVNEHEILWINSAGNIGAGYFPGRFTGGGVLGTRVHSFQDPNVVGDARNTLLVPVSRERDIQVTLQWDDPAANFSLITLGSCNQNDPESFAPIVTDAIEGMLTVRQTIGTDVLQQISDYTRVPAPAALQTCANNPDGIQDNEIYIGVRSDNAETETPFSLYIQGALPAEYDPDIRQSLDPVVLVPGDLAEVLTVGAFDPRTNRMAWYSGRSNSLQYYKLNNNDVDYSDNELVKPDIVTYGELSLPSGRKFFGTSAATPLTGGVAVLLYNEEVSFRNHILTITECIENGAIGHQLPKLTLKPSIQNSNTSCGQYEHTRDISSDFVDKYLIPALAEAVINSEAARLESDVQQLARDALQFANEDETSALTYILAAVAFEGHPADINPIFYEILSNSRTEKILQESNSVIKDIAINSDGTWVAAASFNWVFIWDINTGDLIHELYMNTDYKYVNSISFSPDGTLFASGEQDGTVRLWDVNTWEMVYIMPVYDTGVELVRFTPDSQILMTGDGYGEIVLWRVTDNKKLMPIGEIDNSSHFTFSPNGTSYATVDPTDDTISIWDIDNSQLIQVIDTVDQVANFKFSANSLIMTIFDYNRDLIVVWDVEKNVEITTIYPSTEINVFAISPDGSVLATTDFNGSITFWETDNPLNFVTVYGHNQRVNRMLFTHDGKKLLTGSDDGSVRLWTVQIQPEFLTIDEHGEGTASVLFSPDGRILATSGQDGFIKLWDTENEYRLITEIGNVNSGQSILFIGESILYSPDGKLIIYVGANGKPMLWSVADNKNFELPNVAIQGVSRIDISSDGRFLAMADRNNNVIVWDMVSNTKLLTREFGVNSIVDIEFSPDGTLLAAATSGYNGSIQLLDLLTLEDLPAVDIHSNITLEFSPDGRLLLSGSFMGNINVLDLHTMTQLSPFDADSYGDMTSLVFSPDRRILVSGGTDSTIRLWDVESRTELLSLWSQDSPTISLAFSPDGTMFASADADGVVKLWQLSSLPVMREWLLQNRTTRDITCRERRNFEILGNCDENGEVVASTPIPSPTLISVPTWTPFWSPAPSATPTPLPKPYALNYVGITPLPTAINLQEVGIGEYYGEVPLGEYSWWLYDAQPNELLTIRTSADWDTEIFLFDPYGYEIASNDDFLEGSTDSQISEVLLEGGRYAIKVRSYRDESGGSYTMLLTSE